MKRAKKASFVLDTSAVLAFFEGEPGCATVKDVLRRSRKRHARAMVSLMTVYEMLYIVSQEQGDEEGLRRVLELRSLPIVEAPLSSALAIRAAHLKARYPISAADSWIAATAAEEGAILLHKDPEFLSLEDEVLLQALPFK